MRKEYKIDESLVGIRLDKVLTLLDTSLSRTKASDLIEEDYVSVNDNFVNQSYKTKLNDNIVIEFEEVYDDILEPEDIPLDIVYEDDDVLVVNKPAGMVVHPANGHHSGTLVNALLYRFKNLSTLNGETRPGIVHRIDKETSGLIMVAKTNFAHQKLQDQLKDKTLSRNYFALVQGELPYEAGKIEGPIGRSKVDRKKMMVVSDGKDATTLYNIVERFSGFTFISCSLLTGRTHQIRVHLSTIKFPIVGDIIYGPKKPLLNHMLLHAYELQFKHPRTGKLIKVYADMPEYFKKALNDLRTNGKFMEENENEFKN